MDDTFDLREQLSDAWRVVFDGAVARGYPAQAVAETMAGIVHERMADLFGAPAAASYLQLLAEQLRAGDHDTAVSLLQGAPVEEVTDADLTAAVEDEPETFLL